MVNENTKLDDLFVMAVAELKELKKDEKFLVKTLFKGYEWERIPKGARTKLGSLFFSYATGKGNKRIKPLNKTPQNQQIYIKL